MKKHTRKGLQLGHKTEPGSYISHRIAASAWLQSTHVRKKNRREGAATGWLPLIIIPSISPFIYILWALFFFSFSFWNFFCFLLAFCFFHAGDTKISFFFSFPDNRLWIDGGATIWVPDVSTKQTGLGLNECMDLLCPISIILFLL